MTGPCPVRTDALPPDPAVSAQPCARIAHFGRGPGSDPDFRATDTSAADGRFGACRIVRRAPRAPLPSHRMAVIEAHELRRTYRTTTGIVRRKGLEVEAVRGVTFEVGEGELFGLLGPNGAGKTTTIKMLITLLLPTSGSARVLGHDVVREAGEVRRKIGYVFGGDRGLYERLSALDNLRYFAELYAVPPREQRRRIAEPLDLVGLAGRGEGRGRGFSRGMRPRPPLARGPPAGPPG